jgi:hypothetical protein
MIHTLHVIRARFDSLPGGHQDERKRDRGQESPD